MNGMPISVRLVLVTAGLVAAAVLASVYFGQKAVSRLASSYVSERRAAGEAAIAREAELLVAGVRGKLELPLGTNTYSEVAPLLEQALADNARDGQVQWLVALDDRGSVVARTNAAPDGNALAALASAHPVPTDANVVEARLPGDAQWMYSAAVRLGTQVVGAVRMGVSSAGLERALAQTLADARAEQAKARKWLWLVAVTVLLAGMLLALWQGLSLAGPLRALTRQAQSIAAGNLHERVASARGDELGVLAQSFNYMTERVGELLIEQADKAGLEKELSLAREVQQAMLPESREQMHGALSWIGFSEPAASCGGDWWVARPLDDGRVAFVIGDATGHGIHSAMIAATARGAFAAVSALPAADLTPTMILRAIDQAIRESGEHRVQMTCWAGICRHQPNGTEVRYASGGHPAPWAIAPARTGAGEAAAGEASVQVLTARGDVLGEPQTPARIVEATMQLAAGALLWIATDGLTERANAAGREFGERRLRELVVGLAAESLPLAALRDHVRTELDRFADGLPPADDTTFVVVRC